MSCKNHAFLFLCFTVYCACAFAKVELPPVISNNMVLQQNSNPLLWGKATPQKPVSIQTSWNKKTYKITADVNGGWKVNVSTPSYGGPYTITVSEENTIVLNNVMIGEVWLCSGQSNMDWPVGGRGKVLNHEEEIASANYANIRLLQVRGTKSNVPNESVIIRNDGWDICSPQTVEDFSAVAYFFARELHTKTGIPVGVIQSAWGGTVAEAWTSYETLKTFPDFAKQAAVIRGNDSNAIKAKYQADVKKWQQNQFLLDKGFSGIKPVWASERLNTGNWQTMPLPGFWDKHGLQAFNGVIWFRKNITIPQSLVGRDLVLSLGNIDDEDITWFNGVKVGETKKHDVERVYKIPASIVKAGENIIAVRVNDIRANGGFYGNSSEMYIGAGSARESLAGNWLYNISYSSDRLPPAPYTLQSPNHPTILYNGMIHPLRHYKIRGAIWYQGESNANRAYQYHSLFPAMIKDWRKQFSSGEFPFYFVQLANFMQKDSLPSESQWAELREAQLMATAVSNTGMAVTIDIGEANNIHPKNKQDVGKRLALIALNKIHKKQNEYSGPLYKSQAVKNNKVIISFNHAAGLQAHGGSLKGFAIAGSDKKFYWANAVITGNKVEVFSTQVTKPVAVRYSWGNNPDGNLYNSDGLPASPFRTDKWRIQ